MEQAENLEQMIECFRQRLPAERATARTIDQYDPWERIAQRAVDDGYVEFASGLGAFVEVVVRRGS